jgi:hypothetical protein
VADFTRARRLSRIVHLRKLGAPLWVVRSEQVALALHRKGLKHAGIGKPYNQTQRQLYEKFVQPCFERGG